MFPGQRRVTSASLLINGNRSISLLILVADYYLQPVWHLLVIIINPSNDKHPCPFSFLQGAIFFASFDLDQTVAQLSAFSFTRVLWTSTGTRLGAPVAPLSEVCTPLPLDLIYVYK